MTGLNVVATVASETGGSRDSSATKNRHDQAKFRHDLWIRSTWRRHPNRDRFSARPPAGTKQRKTTKKPETAETRTARMCVFVTRTKQGTGERATATTLDRSEPSTCSIRAEGRQTLLLTVAVAVAVEVTKTEAERQTRPQLQRTDRDSPIEGKDEARL